VADHTENWATNELSNPGTLRAGQSITTKEEFTAFMANTKSLSKEERKKARRAARKKRKAEKPLKPRDYARGSKKPKVKKLARGQAKR
jgi:hypothetical protein